MTNMTTKDFVLSQPEDLDADEVVRLAKEAGIEVGRSYIHTLRSKERRSRGVSRRRRSAADAMEALEEEFTRVAFSIGFARTSELIREMREKLHLGVVQ